MKEVSFLVVPVGLVDDHVATRDPVMIRFESGSRFLDGALDDLGMGKVMKRDLKWSVHGRSL